MVDVDLAQVRNRKEQGQDAGQTHCRNDQGCSLMLSADQDGHG